MINRQFKRGTQFEEPAITPPFPDGVFWVRGKKGMMAGSLDWVLLLKCCHGYYHGRTHRLSILLTLPFMRPLIQNFKIPPPRANTWHLTITCARGVGNLTRRAFPREGNLTFSRVGWGIWTKSVKFNLLRSFRCQTTLFESNIFLVAKWRSTRKCQRNDVKMRFEQLCTSTYQPMTSCAVVHFSRLTNRKWKSPIMFV